MKLQTIAAFIVIGLAIAAGLEKLSFWWVLIPVFGAGSLSLSNGPGFDLVVRANQEGRLGVFPRLLFFHCLGYFVSAAIVFGLTRLIA